MSSDPTGVTDIDALEARRLSGEGALLLDVREDDEWEAGHAPEAVHLAMGLIADRMHEIPLDRTVVCVCRVGGRSGTVAHALLGQGYDVRNLGGGMVAWDLAGLPVVAEHGAGARII